MAPNGYAGPSLWGLLGEPQVLLPVACVYPLPPPRTPICCAERDHHTLRRDRVLLVAYLTAATAGPPTAGLAGAVRTHPFALDARE